MKVIALLVLVASALAICHNATLVSFFSRYPNIASSMLSSPVIQSDGLCSYLDGKESCCNNDTYTHILSHFEVWRRIDVEFQDYLVNAVGKCHTDLELVRGNITHIRSLPVCTPYQWEHNPTGCQNLQNIVDDLLDKLEATVNAMKAFCTGFAHATGTCLHVQIRYLAGLYCLACDPDAQDYVWYGTRWYMRLHDNVCTAFFDGCYGMQYALKNFFDNMGYIWGIAIVLPNPPCHGYTTIRECVCSKLVNGWNSNINVTIYIPTDFGQDKIEHKAMIEHHLNLINDVYQDYNVMHKNIFKSVSKYEDIKAYAEETDNEYGTDGVDVVANGETSKLDTTWDVPASALTSFLSIAALVAVLLI